ncbi:hypothetical protein E2C01_030611 [Portunus trituberculatus]|uniref:Uncharacterized protein n=1 Tax=Portunus trituberculatus TaxID=210409 RepID=A0A5B7EV95_PORTR|nr:hypothetical protein [Portunus trituberculatus]
MQYSDLYDSGWSLKAPLEHKKAEQYTEPIVTDHRTRHNAHSTQALKLTLPTPQPTRTHNMYQGTPYGLIVFSQRHSCSTSSTQKLYLERLAALQAKDSADNPLVSVSSSTCRPSNKPNIDESKYTTN